MDDHPQYGDTSENMKVSWDDYSQYMEKLNMFQTTKQLLLNNQTFDRGTCGNMVS